jgi:hypothetical protein
MLQTDWSLSRSVPSRPPLATGRNSGPSVMPAACSHAFAGRGGTDGAPDAAQGGADVPGIGGRLQVGEAMGVTDDRDAQLTDVLINWSNCETVAW